MINVTKPQSSLSVNSHVRVVVILELIILMVDFPSFPLNSFLITIFNYNIWQVGLNYKYQQISLGIYNPISKLIAYLQKRFKWPTLS